MLEVNRKELKYRLNAAQVPALRRRLAPFLLTDCHGGTEGYTVRSVYFDTLWDSDFLDKVDGCDCRQKIRLRIYGTGGPIKLELKQKSGGFYQRPRLRCIFPAQRNTDGAYPGAGTAGSVPGTAGII